MWFFMSRKRCSLFYVVMNPKCKNTFVCFSYMYQANVWEQHLHLCVQEKTAAMKLIAPATLVDLAKV